jgi:hypothetical protein
MDHTHHIVPRHVWLSRFGNLKGFNAPDNKTTLTIEQHAQAHQLLHELHGRHEDFVAWRVLSGQMTITEGREFVRRERIKAFKNTTEEKEIISKRFSGSIPWNKGVSFGPMSEEQKELRRGHIPWNKGLTGYVTWKHSEATLNIMRARRNERTSAPRPKGFKVSLETKEKMRRAAFIREAHKRELRSI